MGQNLVWGSFSIDPSYVLNYIKIRRGHDFHVDLIRNDPCTYIAEPWLTSYNDVPFMWGLLKLAPII